MCICECVPICVCVDYDAEGELDLAVVLPSSNGRDWTQDVGLRLGVNE